MFTEWFLWANKHFLYFPDVESIEKAFKGVLAVEVQILKLINQSIYTLMLPGFPGDYFRVFNKHEDRQLSQPQPANPVLTCSNKRTLSLQLVDSGPRAASPAPPPSSCGHSSPPAVGS